MDIETLSVGEIERMIAMCPHLKAYIDKNDKTPFTDGHIELYGGLPQSNATRTGRVSVQVKGRSFRRAQAARQSWSISQTDLRAHLQDSGVLYFFVRVERATGQCAAYFVNLAPFRIADLLKRAGPTAKSISVELKRLPEDVADLERIVGLALRTRDQNPEAGFDPMVLEGAQGFTLYAASRPNLDVPLKIDLASGDVALVVHTAGGMAIPLSGEFEIIPGDYTKHPAGIQIASGATTYHDVYRQRLDEETVELSLGDGVALTVKWAAAGGVITASYRAEGSLAGRLRAFEFMRSLRATGIIEVDGKPASLGTVTSNELTSSMEETQADLHKLAALFDSLGVDTDVVDLDSISEDEFVQLGVLYSAFVNGQEVQGALPQSGFVLQRVGLWRLMILAEPGGALGSWRLVDVFSPDFRQQFWAQPVVKGSRPHPVTPYDLIEQDQMPLVLNLRLGSIVGAYEAISDWPDTTFGQANHGVLHLIAASDACQDRRVEFLDAATALNEWLLDVQGAEPHHLVNRWQILHRQAALTPDQRHEIRELKHQMAGGNVHKLASLIEVACAILLGDAEEVTYLVSSLSSEDVDTIQKWPIWTLNES